MKSPSMGGDGIYAQCPTRRREDNILALDREINVSATTNTVNQPAEAATAALRDFCALGKVLGSMLSMVRGRGHLGSRQGNEGGCAVFVRLGGVGARTLTKETGK